MRIRRARVDDSEAVIGLVGRFAHRKLMLPLKKDFLFEHINDYFICEDRGRPIGVVFLRVYSERLAEIRSLAVDEKHQSRGIGRKLVLHGLKEASSLGINEVFALTVVPGFFTKLGFKTLRKEKYPEKIWLDCVSCPKKDDCDETTVAIHLKKRRTSDVER